MTGPLKRAKEFVMRERFLAVFLLASAPYAEAGASEQTTSNNTLVKIGRGLTNIATFPGEFITQMPPAMNESPDYLTGTLVTVGRGIGYGIMRLGAGVYDVVTSPVPTKPIMQPPTIFEKSMDYLST